MPRRPEAVLEARVKLGALTLNEMRDSLGLDPYANPAADRPMVLTATGYVPIEANAGGEADKSARIPLIQKYDPNQPRVPADNPAGGQWTTEDENGWSSGSGGSDDKPNPSVQYAAAAENDDAANDNLTPEQTCQKAYSDALALARINPSLSSADYLNVRRESAVPLDDCLHLADGDLPISPQGDFVLFHGGGAVIFRADRPPIYVRPPGRQ